MHFGQLIQSQLLIYFSTTISLALFLYQQLNDRFHPNFNVTREDDTIHRLINYFYSNVSEKSFKNSVLLFSHKFACGGGIVSTTAASLVSVPCAFDKYNICCERHDVCYDSKIGQDVCDAIFCHCLTSMQSEGLYCDLFTRYGLCASTRLFGFLFYEHGQFNQSIFDKLGVEERRILDAYLATESAFT